MPPLFLNLPDDKVPRNVSDLNNGVPPPPPPPPETIDVLSSPFCLLLRSSNGISTGGLYPDLNFSMTNLVSWKQTKKNRQWRSRYMVLGTKYRPTSLGLMDSDAVMMPSRHVFMIGMTCLSTCDDCCTKPCTCSILFSSIACNCCRNYSRDALTDRQSREYGKECVDVPRRPTAWAPCNVASEGRCTSEADWHTRSCYPRQAGSSSLINFEPETSSLRQHVNGWIKNHFRCLLHSLSAILYLKIKVLRIIIAFFYWVFNSSSTP